MTREEIRQHAAAVILSHARDVERMSIREYLDDEEFEFTNEDVTAIYDLIYKARIAVEFPEDTDD